MRRHNGFTLIELLVVIAIIAILAAILFPVFAKAREKARQASCTSNFKQIATAILSYVQDYDETMPGLMAYPMDWSYNWQTNFAWPQAHAPYVKNWQVYRCPSDPYARDEVLSAGAPPGRQRDWEWALRSDAGYNYMYLSPMDVDANFVGKGQAAISAPANCLMLADSIWDFAGGAPVGGGNWFIEAPSWWYSDTYWWFGGWAIDDPNSWLRFGGTWPRHNDVLNVAYTDGHVKVAKIDGLINGVDPRTRVVWDRTLYIWDRD